MATKTHLATKQIRMQQWAEMVRECNSRPHGMKVTDWCREYGITKDAYYYRLNRVRKTYLDAVQTETEQAVVPVSACLLSGGVQTEPTSPGIDITLNQAVLHVTDRTSPELLAMVLKVLSHAE